MWQDLPLPLPPILKIALRSQLIVMHVSNPDWLDLMTEISDRIARQENRIRTPTLIIERRLHAPLVSVKATWSAIDIVLRTKFGIISDSFCSVSAHM